MIKFLYLKTRSPYSQRTTCTMSTEPIQIRTSLLDTLQVDLIGPSGGLGDHCELLPHAPSRWYLTGFLVPTDAEEDQRYDPNSDDEVDQAPAVATVDLNHISAQVTGNRSRLPSITEVKKLSLAANSLDRQALHETKSMFQKSIDAKDGLASCTEGVLDAKTGLVSIA
jgi:hypothetical protein